MTANQEQTEVYTVKVELPKELADALRLAKQVSGNDESMEIFLADHAKDSARSWVECYLPDMYNRLNLDRFK